MNRARPLSNQVLTFAPLSAAWLDSNHIARFVRWSRDSLQNAILNKPVTFCLACAFVAAAALMPRAHITAQQMSPASGFESFSVLPNGGAGQQSVGGPQPRNPGAMHFAQPASFNAPQNYAASPGFNVQPRQFNGQQFNNQQFNARQVNPQQFNGQQVNPQQFNGQPYAGGFRGSPQAAPSSTVHFSMQQPQLGNSSPVSNMPSTRTAPNNTANRGTFWVPQPGDSVMPQNVANQSAAVPAFQTPTPNWNAFPTNTPAPAKPSFLSRMGHWKDKIFKNPFASNPFAKKTPVAPTPEFGDWTSRNLGPNVDPMSLPQDWKSRVMSEPQPAVNSMMPQGGMPQPNIGANAGSNYGAMPTGFQRGAMSRPGMSTGSPGMPYAGAIPPVAMQTGMSPYAGTMASGMPPYSGSLPEGSMHPGSMHPGSMPPLASVSPDSMNSGSMFSPTATAPPLMQSPDVAVSPPCVSGNCGWGFSVLPDGLVYKPYLAGPRESRIAASFLNESTHGWVWDGVIGGRVGLFRHGTTGGIAAEGVQLDLEAAVFPRLNLESRWELESADFQFGLPITWAPQGRPVQFKFGFYHFGSHFGDDFIRRNSLTVPARMYTRDAFNLGIALQLTDSIRSYTEASIAFQTEGAASPWQFQFGLDYLPMTAFTKKGAPFFAINGLIREEVDYGGGVTVMTGWQWRGRDTDNRLRLGLHYFNGKSNQLAFWNEHEELIGLGVWYDY